MTRQRLARGEGERLREEILEAAEKLLVKTGSEDEVSIRAVADAVGVTAPSIYRHFEDKQALIFEVCARHFQRMQEFIRATAEASDDPIAGLEAMARAYVRFATENPEHYRIMFMGRSDHTPERYADAAILQTGAFGDLAQVVAGCMAAGRLRPDLPDATGVAYVLWAAIHGVVSLAVARPNMPGPSLEERVQAMLDVLLRGMLN